MAQLEMEGETTKVLALLGGRRVFRDSVDDVHDLQEALRKGFPFAAFDSLLDVLAVRRQELAALLGVASRTLARRKATRHLSAIESDRLYRVAHIVQTASETLGSIAKARAWLHKENRVLGGHAPIQLLDTEIGTRRVEELLRQIDHGIYS